MTPRVFWIFGRSGAGKSTLAVGLSEYLRKRGIPVLELDGDILRSGLSTGLGFSECGRAENLRRAAEVAKLGVNSGLCVVASFITPMKTNRFMVRKIVGDNLVSMIYADTSLEVCRERDTKGLYSNLTPGIGSEFQPPNGECYWTIRTNGVTPDESIASLAAFAQAAIGPK